MRLLVSVVNREEAAAALAGGADIIDAKDPAKGPLGAVSIAVLLEICAATGGARPVTARGESPAAFGRRCIAPASVAPPSHMPNILGRRALAAARFTGLGATLDSHHGLLTAALGDAAGERTIERDACAYASAGAMLVKVGFAGVASAERAASLLAAAVGGATSGSGGRCGVVAVAYADAHRVASLAPDALTEAAARTGAAGVLLDTADKNGPGVRGLFSPDALAAWVAQAHDARLLVAVAGRLQTEDIEFVRDAGADIAGVRGAACEGGRTGRVTVEKVRLLHLLCADP